MERETKISTRDNQVRKIGATGDIFGLNYERGRGIGIHGRALNDTT